jgi:hypothetical protein
MSKAYEYVARLIRWALIGVAVIIVVLPTLISVGYTI